MEQQIRQSIQQFLVIGISQHTCPVSMREKFHIPDEEQKQILKEGKAYGISTMIPVSTCNRTEIYAQTTDSELIVYLLRKYTHASMEELVSHCYIYRGHAAIKHLFKVSCGMDSQILGELEIAGQLKQAFQNAYEQGMVNTFTERLIQYVNQSGKKIKSKTDLSRGAASVSRAAVQHLRARITNLSTIRILLFGVGEIGQNTCDNLLKYVHPEQITVVNRTFQRAEEFAGAYRCHYDHYENSASYIEASDVIIVATGAKHPTITSKDFENTDHKKHTIVLDLSIPRNVSPNVSEYSNIELITLDGLQEQNNEVLQAREDSVPQAMEIIKDHEEGFYNWLKMNSLSPVLSGFQHYLTSIKQKEVQRYKGSIPEQHMDHVEQITDRIIKKISGQCISYLRNNSSSCHTPAEVISSMFKLPEK